MSLIIPCCCDEQTCIFPAGYKPKGSGEIGTCCNTYSIGDCCVYDFAGYKIECIQGISYATCAAKNVPGEITTQFYKGQSSNQFNNRGLYSSAFRRPACGLTAPKPRPGQYCRTVEGVRYLCRDGPDEETERDICCQARSTPESNRSCTNPDDVTKHIFWLSYDGEEITTQAGGITASRHEIEVEIIRSNLYAGKLFRGYINGNGGPSTIYNDWNEYGCNIINGTYKETWTNRLDNEGRTPQYGYGEFLKYGESTLTTPTDHYRYDLIILALQTYIDEKNAKYNSFKTETQEIKAQWKINQISWLWYNSSSKVYKFDPPCVSWTSTLNRSFTGKYGGAYTFSRPPIPGISANCDQGCCCNNILPVYPGDIGCECKDTCGSVSTTTILNFASVGGCDSTTNPLTYITPKTDIVYVNNTNNTPIITDVDLQFGSVLGGSLMNVFGDNLLNTTSVIIGGNTASDIVINSNTSVSFITPPGITGMADIELISGTSSAKLINKFRYNTVKQDLFGYLFWITKGIINTKQFISNETCSVNSIETVISNNELIFWKEEPDSFNFDTEWKSITDTVSELNSNSEVISKGEFYTANNLKYLQYSGTTDRIYKSPCTKITWDWSVSNSGCVDTLNNKLELNCVPCSNNCCYGVCSENNIDEISSKCGSFSKTQHIGQADCSESIISNNLLSALPPATIPTNQTTSSDYTVCECISDITECECVNKPAIYRDRFYRSEWRWKSGSTGSTGSTGGCGCNSNCCVKDPDGNIVANIQDITECECDLQTTATGVYIDGYDGSFAGRIYKYNGNVSYFGDACIPPPPTECGEFYEIYYYHFFVNRIDTVSGPYQNSVENIPGVKDQVDGFWIGGPNSSPELKAQQIIDMNLSLANWSSQSFTQTVPYGDGIWTRTDTYGYSQLKIIKVPMCGLVVEAGSIGTITVDPTYYKTYITRDMLKSISCRKEEGRCRLCCDTLVSVTFKDCGTDEGYIYTYPHKTLVFPGWAPYECDCPPLVGNSNTSSYSAIGSKTDCSYDPGGYNETIANECEDLEPYCEAAPPWPPSGTDCC